MYKISNSVELLLMWPFDAVFANMQKYVPNF